MIEDLEKVRQCFLLYYIERTDIMYFQEYLASASLTDKQFISKAVENSKIMKSFVKEGVTIGLTGIQKLFFQMYVALVPAGNMKRVILNTRAECETIYKLSFENDFIPIELK